MDNDFCEEIRHTSTYDLKLILQDQKDLYSDEELQFIEAEFKSREDKNLTPSDDGDSNYEDYSITNNPQITNENRIKALVDKGIKGYYEYTVISIQDEKSGAVNINLLNERINDLALEGWQLKTAFTNEIGKNSSSISILGGTGGTNSTIEQNILIFERYILF